MERIEYVRPEDIEKRSFEIISEELRQRGICLPAEEAMITKRVIHTSADFDYAETMTYTPGAVQTAKKLLREGADIVTDTNMVLAVIVVTAQFHLLTTTQKVCFLRTKTAKNSSLHGRTLQK